MLHFKLVSASPLNIHINKFFLSKVQRTFSILSSMDIKMSTLHNQSFNTSQNFVPRMDCTLSTSTPYSHNPSQLIPSLFISHTRFKSFNQNESSLESFRFSSNIQHSVFAKRSKTIAFNSVQACQFQTDSTTEPNASVLYKPDAILVLAGGQHVDGSVPLWVERRLDASIDIHNAFIDEDVPIVCLGGGTPHKLPVFSQTGHVIHESSSCANYLLEKGIKASNILKEWGSYDTVANGYFGLVWHSLPRDWSNLVIITSDFHMPRSKLIFDWIFGLERAGLGNAKTKPNRKVYEIVQGTGNCKDVREFKSIYKIDHGGLRASNHGYKLQFVSVSDHGIDPLSINARIKKEESSIIKLKEHMARISTLSEFHIWFHTEHGAYCVSKQNEFGSNVGSEEGKEQDATSLCY